MGVDLLLSGRLTITSGQAAEILGFSRWTLVRRVDRGLYANIGRCKTWGGWLFDMEDVVRAARPLASDAQIDALMEKYRQDFISAKRNRKHAKTLQEKGGHGGRG